MHFPDFRLLRISSAEGFSYDDERSGRTVQYVQISLDQKSGKRASAIPIVIDNYNKMEGRSEKVEPVVLFSSTPPLSSSLSSSVKAESIICFKKAAPIDRNPILLRIFQAKTAMDQRYWKWCCGGGSSSCLTTNTTTTTTTTDAASRRSIIISGVLQGQQRSSTKRHAVTSVSDILISMKLPESVVSVQRAYDELSEPYFRKFNSPLGEGTGCIPIEHREFMVSEIKRLFEVELCYIQQPSTSAAAAVVENCLPPNAVALVDHGGWMGDVLLTGGDYIMDAVKGGSVICDLRVENSAMARKMYSRTGKTQQQHRSGAGYSLREFFIFYALKWNNAGNGSVFQNIDTLYAGWTGALETMDAFRSLISGSMGLLLLSSSSSLLSWSSCVKVEGSMLKVPSVERLLELLCSEGLIVVVGMMMMSTQSAAAAPAVVVVRRMTVLENCTPVASMLRYFQTMLRREWVGITKVEVTAIDVVKALNGGDVGAYRRSCVSQFMRPFLFDGSVEGYSWKEGCVHFEKYIIDVERIASHVLDK